MSEQQNKEHSVDVSVVEFVHDEVSDYSYFYDEKSFLLTPTRRDFAIGAEAHYHVHRHEEGLNDHPSLFDSVDNGFVVHPVIKIVLILPIRVQLVIIVDRRHMRLSHVYSILKYKYS